ncbi:CdaR family protein [Hydrogenothermus marinus]|uniref:YbbR-like protein n=1 Tax=Hydrogenothermus marinus TaxID=133270 RepID=A0A3M0B6Y6_9AQUI|nr:CdaR family protein [Hydrogenothermus marinus]RMA93170.1 YbbR-like protein [Hydrogenothermus marinus]
MKDLILNNLPLKILALVISFLLWLNINVAQKTKLQFTNDIKVENIPNNLIIKKVYPDKVVVVLEGSKKNINKLDISKIQSVVEGQNLKEGENKLKVKIKGSLKDFKIISIKPKEVIIYTEKKK